MRVVEVFFMGSPRHGYLDNDRHFGGMKQDWDEWVQERARETISVVLHEAARCAFLNSRKNTCARVCGGYDLSRSQQCQEFEEIFVIFSNRFRQERSLRNSYQLTKAAHEWK